MFPLSCLQSMSLHRQMDWELAKAQSDVTIGRISNHAAFPIGHNMDIIEILPGSVRQEFPTSETPKQAGMSALIEDYLVGNDGRLYPERIIRIAAPLWFVPCSQGCPVWDCSEPLHFLQCSRSTIETPASSSPQSER